MPYLPIFRPKTLKHAHFQQRIGSSRWQGSYQKRVCIESSPLSGRMRLGLE